MCAVSGGEVYRVKYWLESIRIFRAPTGDDSVAKKTMQDVARSLLRECPDLRRSSLATRRIDVVFTEPLPRPSPLRTPNYSERQTSLKDETPQRYRTWTDRSGRFAVEARIVGVIGPRLKIERKDSRKVLTVDRDRLSEEDQEYVRQYLRRVDR
jgi:hypothetical protein